ncbi:unnamed protein product [Echinostoma caproni]|uniref:Non-structural maintenance of chromosomes element 4 n=1 Tax=Echinostoma caproni TaxID=27848 RepID=A0A183A7I4_9TREM|nr:unnamed protein product [Echinostoma caproni]
MDQYAYENYDNTNESAEEKVRQMLNKDMNTENIQCRVLSLLINVNDKCASNDVWSNDLLVQYKEKLSNQVSATTMQIKSVLTGVLMEAMPVTKIEPVFIYSNENKLGVQFMVRVQANRHNVEDPTVQKLLLNRIDQGGICFNAIPTGTKIMSKLSFDHKQTRMRRLADCIHRSNAHNLSYMTDF